MRHHTLCSRRLLLWRAIQISEGSPSIALLVISSSAVEIPSTDWTLVRVLRRSPSVEFNSDNEFSFVPEGDCNPEPSLMFTGTSLPGWLA